MRTPRTSAPPCTRAAIILILIILAVSGALVGVGYAEPADTGAGTSTTAAEGPDTGGGDGTKDGEGAMCANGRRDDNAADGVCSRDADVKDVPAKASNISEGTPCTTSADACIDLAAKKAWLIDGDGKVVRGPVPISSGGPGYETPRGTFNVMWKNRDHRSKEFDNAPMPFAVFFADGGIATHGGDIKSTSHGCVRLDMPDAEAFFNFLDVDDEVQVH